MNGWINSLFGFLRNDKAESSIMQTITIATSAILIAAGTVTAPNIINAQKVNIAQSQLGNMAFAQEAWKAETGFVNTNYIPGRDSGGSYPANYFDPALAGSPLPNLSTWRYPYDFSTFAIAGTDNQWCYKGEYVISVQLKDGKEFYVTSANVKPVTLSKLVLPITCKPGYVPPADTTPTVVDQIARPTTTPNGLAVSSTKENISWNGVSCASGTTPAYQVRATVTGAQPRTVSGAWASSTTQNLSFLNEVHKNSANVTQYKIAAKCRNDNSGVLSVSERVSTTLTG